MKSLRYCKIYYSIVEGKNFFRKIPSIADKFLSTGIDKKVKSSRKLFSNQTFANFSLISDLILFSNLKLNLDDIHYQNN